MVMRTPVNSDRLPQNRTQVGVAAAFEMTEAWVAVALLWVRAVPTKLLVTQRMATATMLSRFGIFLSHSLGPQWLKNSAVRSAIVECGKGGFPRLVQVHPVPDSFEGGGKNWVGGSPLLLHLVCPEDLVPA